MLWDLWQPWYERIVQQLGLDRDADRYTAEVLDKILPEQSIEPVRKMINEKDCIILGAGPSLEEDLTRLERANWLNKTLIAADGATSAVMMHCRPEAIVTDLDGNVDDQLTAWRKGSWMVTHGHGDNLEKVREIVPKIKERGIGTTQTRPFGKLYNFGGFTDGDRAAFMAHELGASRIYLAGMDLGDEIGRWSGNKKKENKLPKLKICGELLAWLASELNADLVNITTYGRDISNVPRVGIS